MNARELHDEWPLMNANERAFLPHEDCKTILRALNLLARTEESTDELVRELRIACVDDSGDPLPDDARGVIDCRYLRHISATIVALKAERERDTGYAKRLAIALQAKHYPECTQWEPFDDLGGILTQIDNMTVGLVREPRRDFPSTP